MTRNQDIRQEIILQLYATRPLPMTASLMSRQAQKNGLDFSEREIHAEAEFLFEQGLASSRENTITGERIYGITSKGVIEYERK